MPLRILYGKADGNTVPYPPIFDALRKNHGYIDTRGCVDRIADIPEAHLSEALADILRLLAAPDSLLISLGCDLGQRDKPNGRLDTRKWAGGYVQIAAARQSTTTEEFALLRDMAKAIEADLHQAAASDRWEVRFILTPIHLDFEEERDTQSAWLWFDAKASTFDLAVASRERLLRAIGESISNFVWSVSKAVRT
jgi:hypothetical protein